MTNNCYILVGVPGSGKTTWLTHKLWRGHYKDAFIASTDDIIDSICTYHCIDYTEGFEYLIKFAEKIFWRDIESAISNNEDIIVDRRNLTYSSRKKIIDFINNSCEGNQKYNFHVIQFTIPPEEEHKRRLQSYKGKAIPENIMKIMIENYNTNKVDIEKEGLTSYIKI